MSVVFDDKRLTAAILVAWLVIVAFPGLYR